VNDLQFEFGGVIVLASESATVHGSEFPNRGIVNRTIGHESESVRHTATPHGVCHESWMAVGVAGQPILPQ
jgi:hypothetical protein